MSKVNFEAMSDKQVQEVFHHLCSARQLLEQELDFKEVIFSDADKYAEMYFNLVKFETWAFNEYLNRKKSNNQLNK